jgi:CheY-like chemotaxis protein
MQLDSVRSGAEALVAVNSNRYDLILMDHMMPIMDGVEATARIRAQGHNGDVHYKKVPIVAMTANAVSGMKEMFLDNDFSDFLSKPIDTITLDSILEKWIPESKKERKPDTGGLNMQENGKNGLPLDIKGLDVNKGISLTGGTYEKYNKVLRVFLEESREKIEEIKRCLEEDDIKLFTTYIHALKNGCWIAGAEALTTSASALESAGSRSDLEFVRGNITKFLTDFDSLLTNIGRALAGEDQKEEKRQIDLDTLRDYLEEYKAALSELKIRELRKITVDLQKVTYNEKTDIALSDILHKRLNGDYDEALVLTNNLLDEISPIGV